MANISVVPTRAPHSSPPPPQMVLLARTDMTGPPLAPLLSQQDLRSVKSFTALTHSLEPRQVQFSEAEPSSVGSSDSLTDEDTDEEAVTELLLQHTYPPAPPEVRKIRRDNPGGFTGRLKVEEAIKGLLPAGFAAFVADLAEKHLDSTVCYSSQDEKALLALEREALKEYAELDSFTDMWPLKQLLIFQCKKTREKEKISNEKEKKERRSKLKGRKRS